MTKENETSDKAGQASPAKCCCDSVMWEEIKNMFSHIKNVGKRLDKIEREVFGEAKNNKGTENEENLEEVKNHRCEKVKSDEDKKGKENNKIHEWQKKQNDEIKVVEKEECQIEVKGEKIILKRNKGMPQGLDNLKSIIARHGNNENKKEQIVRGWLEMQMVNERFHKFMESMLGESTGQRVNNG